MMKRLMLMLAIVIVPMETAAQEGTTDPHESTLRSTALSLGASLDPAAPDTFVVQPQAVASGETRRRPSMVGYIGDATLGSQIRLRFDSGFEITTPDRAEFFYAKCGCYARLPITNPSFDPDAPGPGPGIANDLDFQQLYVLGEIVVNPRISFFGEFPFRWLQPNGFVAGRPCCPAGSFSDSPGFSDLTMGAKLALVAEPTRYVTAQFQAHAPTGDASKGLGTDHWSVEPALLYYEGISDRLALEGQFGAVIPTDGSAGLPTAADEKFSGRILYYGIGPSYTVYSGDQVQLAPVVELVGWRVLGGFQTADLTDASGINIVNLKVGARVTLADRSSIYGGYGRALTDAHWYDDILRFEYRYSF